MKIIVLFVWQKSCEKCSLTNFFFEIFRLKLFIKRQFGCTTVAVGTAEWLSYSMHFASGSGRITELFLS